MTHDGGADRPPADGLDVPVAPVDIGRSGSRRRRVAIVALAAIGATWVGVTALTSDTPLDTRSAAASATAIAAPTPVATVRAPVRPAGPDLPEIDNVALAGAPTPVLLVRRGDDAELVAWAAGSTAAEPIGWFSGALRPDDDGDRPQIAYLSPDLESLVAVIFKSPIPRGGDGARLVTREGVRWESDDVNAFGGLAWSPSGDRFAIVGREDHWLMVSRDENWSAREVDVSVGRPEAAAPPPPETRFLPAEPISPTGFSQSGEWVIGGRFDRDVGGVVPAVRVRVADGSVEPIGAFPLSGPEAPAGADSSVVDAATGRTVVNGPNADIPGGPPQLEIHEPDGEYAFGVRSSIVAAWRWAGDGRLVVLGADGAPFPSRWALQVVDPDGRSRTLLEAPRAANGALLGVRDGHVGVAFTGSEGTETQLVVAALDGGPASAITLDQIGAEDPVSAAWLP